MSNFLPSGYCLCQGSGLDRALLVKFMQRTYQEMEPKGNYAHLSQTVEQYFSRETPLWWVELSKGEAAVDCPPPLGSGIRQPIACLWLGTAIDQIRGDRHTHVFLLYVTPAHRRRGIGSALMTHAETWARARGDRQIGLQVFQSNQIALKLYDHLGFQPQSIWMVKRLQGEGEGERGREN
ncbi:MAG: GNAT family N-acetyltransferase [Kovacikia sp.]